LFVFEATARNGNFTKAASELGVTQPAISRMVSQLESHLGARLFERSSSGVSLTDDGKIFHKHLSNAFNEIETAIDEIEARRIGKETVSLSVSTAFTTHWLMPRVHEFQAAFPSIELRFQLIPGYIRGPVNDVDIGMRFVSGEDSNHDATFVLPEILIPVCSPGYAETMRAQNTMGILLDNTLIELTSNDDWFSNFLPAGEKGYPTKNSLQFSDYGIVLQAALLGQGVAVGWLNIVCYWLRIGALVPAMKDAVATGRLCHLVRSRRKPIRPAVAQVRDWIIEQTMEDFNAVDRMYPELGLAALVRDSH
jgi:DNA-binding transcriptional LysR family regulator